MPNCVNCNRPLPSFGSGEAHPLCPQCRQQILGQNVQAQPVRAASLSFPVTNTLLALNVAIFVVMTLSGVSPMNPTDAQLIRWGANNGLAGLGSEPWRLLTSTFVHAGLFHIATNMWCLWVLGKMAENIFGRTTFLLIYLFTGISASLFSVFLHPMGISVGASGAIFGIAGALITALYFGKLPVPKERLNAALRSLVIFALINLSIGAAVPFIDNAGHVGGLVLGLVIGALLASHLTSDPESKARNRRLVFSALAFVLVAAIWYVRNASRV